ncbi:type I restriction enzyme, S subunit [Enterococcus sp. DIV1767]|uniref:restriction endonuclease subunit S n=1 Tax=Enterococcus sp. DIV1767 TaxID=2774670 RepID=UPI003D2FC194
MGCFLKESKIKGSDGSIAKKLTVKLWRKGVIPKVEIYSGSSATQYYIRKSGQFIYGKLDFLNQAFGVIPLELDGYESTLDSPSFDIEENMNPIFLLEYVSLARFYKFQGNLANGSRRAKRIHVDTFLKMPIPAPSFEEQQKIGNFFKQLDDTIALHQRKIDSLKLLKHAFLQKMLVNQGFFPEVRFADFEEKWTQHKLGDITEKIGSGKTPRGGNATYLNHGIRLIRSQNIFENFVHFDDVVFISNEVDEEMKNSRVQKNDILLNITGASIGRSAVYQLSEKSNVNQHVCIIRPKNKYDPKFIQLNISSQNGQKKIELNQAGGGREGLNFQQISKMTFVYPSYQEQKQISHFLQIIENTIDLYQKKLNNLNQLKKVFLQSMFI